MVEGTIVNLRLALGARDVAAKGEIRGFHVTLFQRGVLTVFQRSVLTVFHLQTPGFSSFIRSLCGDYLMIG